MNIVFEITPQNEVMPQMLTC